LAELREQHRAVVDVLRVLGRAGGDLQPVLDMVAESAGRLSDADVFLWSTAPRVALASTGRPRGISPRMSDQTPYDTAAMIEIGDSPGWRYRSIDADGDRLNVTVVRDSDGCELEYTVPAVVQRGDELGEITRIVIGAQERVDHTKGMGA
jgi:hypothetical protein